MVQFKKILFPTDFSPYADEAKEYACEMARQHGAELHVLHVIDDFYVQVPVFGMGLVLPGLTDDLPKLKANLESEAKRTLADQLPSEFPDTNKVVLSTVFGVPFDDILIYAKKHSMALIVMGTHGRTGLRHMIIGSVAERVVRKASCPVLTIRPKAWGEELVL